MPLGERNGVSMKCQVRLWLRSHMLLRAGADHCGAQLGEDPNKV